MDIRTLRLGRGELDTVFGSLFFMAQILWLERKEFAGNRVVPTIAVIFLGLGLPFAAAAWALSPEPAALAVLVLTPA